MSPHLPTSLLQLFRPVSPECSDKSTGDRHFVTWTDQEDEILRQAVKTIGTDKWSTIAAQFQNKTSRQCRRRWYTYLSTDCKKGGWSPEEDQLLLEAHRKYGNRWTEIAKLVPGRTDNAVKNRFCALGKKQAKKVDVSSSQSSGDRSADEGMPYKRRVLVQNCNISNKRNRDHVQTTFHNSIFQEKQHQFQIKKALQTLTTDQSMAHRAHPLRRAHAVPSEKPVKAIPHPIDKQPYGPRGLKCQGISKLASTVPFDHSMMIPDSGTDQAAGSFSEKFLPRRAALIQNAAFLESLVERRDARLRFWGGDEDAWKSFDWLIAEGEGDNVQATTYASNGLVPVDEVQAFYEDKENYVDLSQISLESQSLSPLSLGQETEKYKQLNDFGCLTPIVQNERPWKFTADYKGLDCSSPSNADSLQPEEFSPTENDCSNFHMEQSTLSRQCEMLTLKEHEAGTACTKSSGVRIDESDKFKSLLPSPSLGDESSLLKLTPDSQFLIDGMASPQFTDSEKQILFGTLDPSYQHSVLESPFLSNTGMAFYCASF